MACYIITHKKFKNFKKPENYKIFLVGASRGHFFGEVFDDVGDNISKKNPNYCELTGLYWLWKHCDDSYIGIVHYRRYFTHSFKGVPILNESEINEKLEKYEAIVPFKCRYKCTVKEDYCKVSGFEKDIEKVRRIIKKKYPKYVHDFDLVFNGHELYLFNMFIMRNNSFKHYCSWLFDVLSDLESQTVLEDYDDYKKRIFGFLAERLENVWIIHNKLKVYEMGLILTEEKWGSFRKLAVALKRSLMYRLKD